MNAIVEMSVKRLHMLWLRVKIAYQLRQKGWMLTSFEWDDLTPHDGNCRVWPTDDGFDHARTDDCMCRPVREVQLREDGTTYDLIVHRRMGEEL